MPYWNHHVYLILENIFTYTLLDFGVVMTFHAVVIFGKVNSVQEACAKCFAVHLLTFEIQTT